MRDNDEKWTDVGTEKIPADVPDEFDPHNDDFPEERRAPSLLADLADLIGDTRTYIEAEAAFQKSRTGYIANRLKYATLFGAAAFGIFHLALIALTVGVVIALSPLVGPWLATLIVGSVLIVAGLFFLRALKTKMENIRSAFDRDEP